MIKPFGSNKRAQGVRNLIVAIVFLFTFIISIIFGKLILGELLSAWLSTGTMTPIMISFANTVETGYSMFDKISGLIMMIVIVGIGVSSFRVATNKVFFIVTFMAAPFLGLISYILSFTLQQMVINIGISFPAVIAAFPISIMIGSNFHWIMLALIVVGSITFFGKKEKGQFLT